MNFKTVIDWLLVAGPVLRFLVMAILKPVLIGTAETPADAVKEMMGNVQLAKITIVVGAIVFIANLVGLTLLARSMQGEDKSGTATNCRGNYFRWTHSVRYVT